MAINLPKYKLIYNKPININQTIKHLNLVVQMINYCQYIWALLKMALV